MKERGFTLLEVIVALVVVGLAVTALMGALSQQRRITRLTLDWAVEEERATAVLMGEFRKLESYRSEEARRAALNSRGEEPILGPWTWKAELVENIPGQTVGLYRISLYWHGRETQTHAALRIS